MTLKAATETNGKGIGCRLSYQDNVLYCAKHDNFLENLATAKKALEMLLGFGIEADWFINSKGPIGPFCFVFGVVV